MEGTIRFIMVVSGREIDTGLKNTLFEIAKWKQKKFIIITPKELIPIFSYYFGTLIKSKNLFSFKRFVSTIYNINRVMLNDQF